MVELENEFTPKKKFGVDPLVLESHFELSEVPDMEEEYQGFVRTTTIDNYQGEENKVH